MTYATKQDCIDRFGEAELIQLTDRANTGSIDDSVLNDALQDADDEINARLASRYTLPLASTPRVLTRIAADIARYYLFDDQATEQVRKRFEDAQKFLAGVASGAVSIGLDGTGTEVTTDSNGAEFSSSTAVFGRDATKGF